MAMACAFAPRQKRQQDLRDYLRFESKCRFRPDWEHATARACFVPFSRNRAGHSRSGSRRQLVADGTQHAAIPDNADNRTQRSANACRHVLFIHF